MRIFLIIIGILLLFPGACGAIFTIITLQQILEGSGSQSSVGGSRDILTISVFSLLIGVAGLFLLIGLLKDKS